MREVQEQFRLFMSRLWQMVNIFLVVLVWLAVFLGAFLGYFGLLAVAVAFSVCVTYIVITRRKQMPGEPEKSKEAK